MTESRDRLLSLLFDEDGGTLENIKFFPGPNCSSEERIFEAAEAAIRATLVDKGADDIPPDGREVRMIGEYITGL